MAYNDKHRQILQYFMQQRIVSEKDAKTIISTLFPEKDIDFTIELINSKITPLEFKINKTVCEQDGDICYVFIATFIDDLNLKRDSNKIIFKKLVDYIIEAGGSVPYNSAKSFNSNMSNTVWEAFFTNKYLITDKHKNVFLSPLAITELEGYFAGKFGDKTCMACLKFVVYGIKCQSCKNVAHGQCLKDYFKNLGSKKCLKCPKQLSVDWSPIKINL